MISLKNIQDLLRGQSLDAVILTDEVNLSYVTGINGLEGAVFVTECGSGYCLTDSRYIEAAQTATEGAGYITQTVPKNDYFAFIAEKCAEMGIKNIGFEDEKMSYAAYTRMTEKICGSFTGVSKLFTETRAVKCDLEAEQIIKAQRIAEKAFDVLLGEIKPGQTENQCRARLEYLMSIYGSERPAFSTILISGAKTSMPHGVPGDKKIEKGDFITFDFGAVCGGYCSDMTRTVAVGSATEKMKKVYNTVLEANITAIEKADVGVSGFDVDKAARDIIKNAGYGEFFGHATGHGVGLEIHEAPSVSPRSENILRQGNIITVEPGIYIPGEFGVRIEDMLYFSPENKINLTNCEKKLIIL